MNRGDEAMSKRGYSVRLWRAVAPQLDYYAR